MSRLQRLLFPVTAIVLLLGSVALGPSMPAQAKAANSKPIHGAAIKLQPLCLSVSRKPRKLHVVFRHGVRGDTYTFAMLPLFGGGKLTGPSMGKHRADNSGFIAFKFPAPNHKRDVGHWQVTATRKVRYDVFKLAAIAHFRVRWSRCSKKHR